MSGNPYESPEQDPSKPPATAQPALKDAEALDRVRLPATVMLITMSVLMVLVAPFTVFNAYVWYSSAGPPPGRQDLLMEMATNGSLGAIQGILMLICGTLILIGARKMRRLESRRWAIAACILSLIPGFSPCCVIGLPIGVWGLMTVNDPQVKESFAGGKS